MAASPGTLFDDYHVRVLSDAELSDLVRELRPSIFSGMLEFDARQAMTDDERSVSMRLRERLDARYRLNFGVYCGQEFVGWSFGHQESAERFYMVNTAILPHHQGKGIYTALLPRILAELKGAGFQIAYSRHVATNNRVIAAKLKAGFVITGLELSDMFGMLVHLSFYFNPIRRKVIDVRAGQAMPDEEVRKYMRFE